MGFKGWREDDVGQVGLEGNKTKRLEVLETRYGLKIERNEIAYTILNLITQSKS